MKLLIVVNVDWFFLSHRLDIASAASAAGWEVHIATTLTGNADNLERHGFIVHEIPIHRSSSNPVGLLRTFLQFIHLFRSLRPNVVHLVTIKPVLLGGIASRLTRVPGVVYAVSGLGHVFVARGSLGSLRRTLVRGLYKLSMGRKNKFVIFQNDKDYSELIGLGCIGEQEAVRIAGSGFDVDSYDISEAPSGPPIFLMASRLIRTKGVLEFVAAASILEDEGVSAEFWLVGAADPANPEGLTTDEVEVLKTTSNVKVLGHRSDVPELMRSVAAVVLPSYYGEGLPKVLIEAAAAGRAVVTTDTPGCRDAIVDGVTGILVPERDVVELAKAMRVLASDRVKLETFGREGRRRAESLFRIQDVVARHLEIYESLANQ